MQVLKPIQQLGTRNTVYIILQAFCSKAFYAHPKLQARLQQKRRKHCPYVPPKMRQGQKLGPR